LIDQLTTIRNGLIWGIWLIWRRRKVGRQGYLEEGKYSLEDHLLISSSIFCMIMVLIGKEVRNVFKEKLKKAWEK
jgi:hypothetical protein